MLHVDHDVLIPLPYLVTEMCNLAYSPRGEYVIEEKTTSEQNEQLPRRKPLF